ncbi:hypothetical protein GG344DRAFT_67873 [Lentinula edodes]|nr:hypothetical protein GG344DRAFT_67873 [Lentinula edodes]
MDETTGLKRKWNDHVACNTSKLRTEDVQKPTWETHTNVPRTTAMLRIVTPYKCRYSSCICVCSPSEAIWIASGKIGKWLTMEMETRVPLTGYGVAAVLIIEGNPDHAKRAAATSTNAIVTTGGAVLGSMTGAAAGVVAGPPGIFAGAVVGGSLGSVAAAQLGMVAEYGIATSIGDAKVKAGVGEISWKRPDWGIHWSCRWCIWCTWSYPGRWTSWKQVQHQHINIHNLWYQSRRQYIREADHLLVRQPNPRQYLNGTVSVNLPTLPTSKQGVTGGHEIDDKNSDKKKKIPRRVVTQRQHQVAHELRQYCIWLKTQYPMKCFLDVYMNASNFFEQFIITNADWELLANECVIAACTELDGKRIGENGAPKTYEWMKNEIDWARKLGKNGSIPLDASRFISEASRQFILDELECSTKKGMNWTSLGDYLRVRAR